MGCVISKRRAEESKVVLSAKLHVAEEEIEQMRCERDQMARAHEQREGEWKRERKRYKEEVGTLEKKLEEEEGRRRALEAAAGGGGVDGGKEWQRAGACCCLVEQMKAEQRRREEAVQKWKQLYLAIKTELDDLILRTKQGERLCWEAGEDVIEGLQRELKAKEEVVELLRSCLAATEKEGAKRDREIDILRQSLRILSSSKRIRAKKNLSRSFWS